MKFIFFAISILFLSNCSAQTSLETDLVSSRVLEFLKQNQVLSIQEYKEKQISEEYIHPESNDSGIPFMYPDDISELPQKKGVYILNTVNDIKVTGLHKVRSKYILDNKQDLYFVEVTYNLIAGFSIENANNGMVFYQQPISQKEYIIMAIDSFDSKWKYLDSLPSEMYYYTKEKFLKEWEKINRGYDIKNITEAINKLRRFRLSCGRRHKIKAA